MLALIRYGFATTLHSQRYLAPALLFLGLVVVFSSNDNGPLPPLYSACAGALFLCATWLTIAVVGVEDPTHRAITIVTAGRSSRVLVASIVVAVLSCVALSALGLLLPLVFGSHPVTGVDLALGVVAQLTGAFTGIAVGLPCSRVVIRRQGYALIIALASVLVLLLAPGMVPVNALLMVMGRGSAADLIAPVSGLFGLALSALVVCGAITQNIAVRRD